MHSLQRPPMSRKLLQNLQGAPLRVVHNKTSGGEATVYVYDVIDPWWGVSAQAFAQALAALDVSTIHLRINSPGGDVFEASAMLAAIRAHPARIISHVDGLAASAASYLAMAADEVRISDSGFFMIHNPWSIAFGDAKAFRKSADTLDKIADSIINEYVKRSKESRATIQEWMDGETWFNAAEAKEHGFADSIEGANDEPKDSFDLSVFSKVPEALQASAEAAGVTRDTQPLRDVVVVRSKREQEQLLRDAGISVADA